MSNKEISVKCKNCGGELEFFPAHQNLICTKCGSEFDIKKEKFEKFTDLNLEDASKDEEFAKTSSVFNCENCGSKIIFSNLEYSTVCPYCGGVQIKKTRLKAGLMPDAIIPFKFDEKEASSKFANAMKHKKFAPSALKKAPKADEIFGIYLPTMCFNAKSKTSYTGSVRKQHRRDDGSVYYTYFPIKGQIDCNHNNVLIESSSHINQLNFEKLKPYINQDLLKYQDDFIRGYSVEYHETPLKTCESSAKEKMKFEIKRAIERRYADDVVELKTNTTFLDETFAYFLLPVYQVNYKFKQKDYRSLINGQTGKVCGKAPVSKLKVWLLVLGIIFGISALITIVMLLK